MNLFENYMDNGLNFARKKCVQAMQQVRRVLQKLHCNCLFLSTRKHFFSSSGGHKQSDNYVLSSGELFLPGEGWSRFQHGYKQAAFPHLYHVSLRLSMECRW